VNARATRMALMPASVPELTSRTCSTPGARETTSSQRATSPSVGRPYDDPRATALRAASTTPGLAWPRISGPQLPT
jgi:hypothetical protein